MPEIVFNVDKQGTMRFIHNDRLRGLLETGEAQIKRASNVEPGEPARGQDPKQWYADMAPSGHDVVLGPFTTRQQALDEEVKWLHAHNLGGLCGTH